MSVDLHQALYKVSLNYLKKDPYSGSADGLRFMLVKETKKTEDENGEAKEETELRLWIWPEPLCFDKTDESEKRLRVFEFSQQGLDEAVDVIMNMQGGTI
ncbi:MAG: hypothetical protein K6E50_09550 [Lachnospiraceae bacterium]|nr:hypothetical protein [Lachnospiraceae bacterium]